MNPGIYEIDINAYHDPANGISRSGIMEFRKTPLHYYNAYINPNREKKKPTQAMVIGNALHSLVLEPEKYEQEYIVSRDFGDRRTKDGKAAYEAFLLEAGDRTVIPPLVEQMAESLKNDPVCSKLITGGLKEKSLFWVDPHTGIRCKARPDIWHKNQVGDLKTIDCAEPRLFQRAMVDHGYHIQAGMIAEGIRHLTGDIIKKFVFICVEKNDPFYCVPYILDEFALEQGIHEFKNTLMKLKECLETNVWTGYQPQTLGLPAWAIN